MKDRTLSRKFTEIFLAQRIEKRLDSKQRILELYINRIYFGSGYYGIAAASEGYFGKEPEHLSVVEAATSPRRFRTPTTVPREASRGLEEMAGPRPRPHGRGGLHRRGHQQPPPQDRGRDRGEDEHHRQVGLRLRKGAPGSDRLLGYEAVSKGGFSIHTTIDGGLQEFAESALKEQLAKIEQHPDFKQETMEQYKAKKAAFQESAHPDQTFPAPKYLQGALMVIDNKTGAVLARVSGRDFNDSMFDRVSQGRRPTGTAFMPFVYAAAFEAGYFPGTLVDDTPMDTRQVMVGGTTGILGEWGVESFDNVYENVITSRRALAKGKNAATVRLGQKVGTEAVVNLARKAGMSFSGDLQKFNATFLGRNPSSLEEFCLAYTIFPNSGRRAEKAHVIANIRDSLGNIIYTPNVAMHGGQAIDRYTAFQISSMLEDSFKYGTAAKAKKNTASTSSPSPERPGRIRLHRQLVRRLHLGSHLRRLDRLRPERHDLSGAFSSDTVLPVWASVMNEAAKKYEPKAFLSAAGRRAGRDLPEVGRTCFRRLLRGPAAGRGHRLAGPLHLHRAPPSRHQPGNDLPSPWQGRSRLQRLTSQQNRKGPLVASYVVQEDTQPVLPIAPTVIGTDDPYKSLAPVIRARVAPVAAEVVAEEVAPGPTRPPERKPPPPSRLAATGFPWPGPS